MFRPVFHGNSKTKIPETLPVLVGELLVLKIFPGTFGPGNRAQKIGTPFRYENSSTCETLRSKNFDLGRFPDLAQFVGVFSKNLVFATRGHTSTTTEARCTHRNFSESELRTSWNTEKVQEKDRDNETYSISSNHVF